MLSQVSLAVARGQPLLMAPSMNCSENFSMISGFFLPMALRKLSASFSEKLARVLEISMTCSW